MNSRPIRVLLIDGQQDEQVISNDLLSQMHGSRFSLKQVTSYDQAVEALRQAVDPRNSDLSPGLAVRIAEMTRARCGNAQLRLNPPMEPTRT